MVKLSREKTIIVSLGLACCILVVLLIISYCNRGTVNNSVGSRENSSSGFVYTNPLLDYEQIHESNLKGISIEEIKKKVADMQQKFGVQYVSLYFRDLNNGLWLGINEKENFSPASLLKLPLMIGYYSYAEDNPGVLGKRYVVTQEHKDDAPIANIIPEKQAVVGQSYTAQELLDLAIIYSDNTAANTLGYNLPDSYIEDVFRRINVPFSRSSDDVYVRVKDYAAFFRVLYNATYLSRKDSEQALQLLTKTAFDQGLVAGVPQSVAVAHKFGERDSGNSEYPIQLHDCGIIYHPQTPYLLCIMTRGVDRVQQEQLIAELSRFFYKQVD